MVRGARAERGGNDARDSRVSYEVTRRMITMMIADIVAQARTNLRQLAPDTVDDIRGASAPVVCFSAGMVERIAALKAELFERVYRHERVMHVMRAAEAVVGTPSPAPRGR